MQHLGKQAYLVFFTLVMLSNKTLGINITSCWTYCLLSGCESVKWDEKPEVAASWPSKLLSHQHWSPSPRARGWYHTVIMCCGAEINHASTSRSSGMFRRSRFARKLSREPRKSLQHILTIAASRDLSEVFAYCSMRKIKIGLSVSTHTHSLLLSLSLYLSTIPLSIHPSSGTAELRLSAQITDVQD